MARFTTTAIIDAPCERVFDYRLNLFNLPEYNRGVSDLRRVSGIQGAPGSIYEFRVRVFGPLGVHVHLTLGNVERPRRIEFLMKSTYPAREVCVFTPVDGHPTATRVDFEATVETPGGALGRWVDALFVMPNLRRQLNHELALMKGYLERAGGAQAIEAGLPSKG